MKYLFFLLISLPISAQHISSFTSIKPIAPTKNFVLPSTHTFQILIEEGDALTKGGTLSPRNDFTGYLPLEGNKKGIVGINAENPIGSVAKLVVDYSDLNGWEILSSEQHFFDEIGGTSRNCSGHVTAWGTLISCEENVLPDANNDGYNDTGWCMEIDTATWRTVDYVGGLANDKIWQMGCVNHENVVIHANHRTAYTGADSDPGYLYKFVMDEPKNLGSGDLFVYKSLSDPTKGVWIQLPNKTIYDQNRTLIQSDSVGARIFKGVEDVEISPIDGKVYFSVKGEHRVYRFDDPPLGITVTNFETYFGGANYTIDWGGGTSSIYGCAGVDNLAFDDLGNLWCFQDGGNHYIWLVRTGHTQANPLVDIFGIAPRGGEPTGITFTPNFKHIFMSFQHPDAANSQTTQADGFGKQRAFDRSVSFVLSRVENLGLATKLIDLISFNGTRTATSIHLDWVYENSNGVSHFEIERNGVIIGQTTDFSFEDKNPKPGSNLYRLKIVAPDNQFLFSSAIGIFFDAPKIIVFPNPNTGTFEVNRLEYRIFDRYGREFFQPLTENGIYWVKAGEEVSKIVVIR